MLLSSDNFDLCCMLLYDRLVGSRLNNCNQCVLLCGIKDLFVCVKFVYMD